MQARSLFLVMSLACLAGCAETRGYNAAFSDKAALTGNAHRFAASPDQAFRATAGTLVQQGFTLEQTDKDAGLIRASRNLADPSNPKISYNITATAYVMAVPDSSQTTIMLSASQQTVLHRETHHWTGIIGPLAIPTGKEYQNIVTREGGITEKGFYDDFFAALEKGLGPSTAAPVLTSAAAKADSGAVEQQHRTRGRGAP